MRDRLLTAAAVAWLAAVVLIAIFGFGVGPDDVGSSPDTLVAGHVWRLLTSSLVVEDVLPYAQLLLLLLVSALVLLRAGPLTWWLAAVLGHIGSALVAYAVMGVAVLLGSLSAEEATDNVDYGISCVFAALLGALALGAARRTRVRRAGGTPAPAPYASRRMDLVVLAGAAIAIFFFFVTIGWYGQEHLYAFAIGFAVAAWRAPARTTAPTRRRAAR
ncbi:hypothetical protein Q5424_22735 [Conexibacter sp. JD483]|uniref:hypothetical protein n=1 Tax=unclassified Conexibacter TaxID=2627773 RepID=UPI002717CE35|nr:MULTISPECIES: hypothetical protein [unclassified Conexibacter]MDO8188462.1 hypothetical protein [Conexibacter sp. CPCC 205706]MDO8199177.1 hypothetical protein [Conexibacter sp. CPCC 205762]MDR9371932.1 hypothetical protein [Conexibacter sp. JD483]